MPRTSFGWIVGDSYGGEVAIRRPRPLSVWRVTHPELCAALRAQKVVGPEEWGVTAQITGGGLTGINLPDRRVWGTSSDRQFGTCGRVNWVDRLWMGSNQPKTSCVGARDNDTTIGPNSWPHLSVDRQRIIATFVANRVALNHRADDLTVAAQSASFRCDCR
jgi:hypothetical protein